MLEDYFNQKHHDVEIAVSKANLPKQLMRATLDVFHDARYTFQNMNGPSPEDKNSAEYTDYSKKMYKFQKKKALEYVEMQER